MTTGQAVEEDPVIDPSLQSLAPIDRRNVNPHPTSEYDTSYITLDFGPSPPQHLSGVPFDIHFLGLETDTPYVQVGELFFKGTWCDIIGTEMIVGRDEENGGAKVLGMTKRRLVLERITVKAKE